jgi:hypothetical protein
VFGIVNGALKQQGMFIFTEINTSSLRHHLSALLHRSERYNIASHSAYLSALKAAGFTIVEIEGYCWMPFTWNSNSSFVPLFARIENLLRLRKWIAQSPWLLIGSAKEMRQA